MTDNSLRVRIYHHADEVAGVCPEGDQILLEYVRPLFEQVLREGLADHVFFCRWPEGGRHVVLRFLAGESQIRDVLEPVIQSTLPGFLRERFPPPPQTPLPIPISLDLYAKLFSRGEPMRRAYTYDMSLVSEPAAHVSLTPLHRQLEDISSRACLEVLAVLLTAQIRYRWALLACESLLQASGLPPWALAQLCDRMSQRWQELSSPEDGWEAVFEQRFRKVGGRLRAVLDSDFSDEAVLPWLDPSSAALLRSFRAENSRILNAYRHSGESFDPQIAETLGQALFHMIHNRFNLALRDELFSLDLLKRLFLEVADPDHRRQG